MSEKLDVQRIVDLALEENLVPDIFFYKWHDLGNWQLETLIKLGMEPSHKLLDVGCGALRLGVQAIPYLEDGNYFGVDAFEPYVRLGEKLIQECKIDKNHNVLHSLSFEFDRFERRDFDFAIAQSVFTHLSRSQIKLCVANLAKVMGRNGVLLFTYYSKHEHRGFLYLGQQPMLNPVLCNEKFLNQMASQHNIRFEIAAFSHPSQKVGLFHFN